VQASGPAPPCSPGKQPNRSIRRFLACMSAGQNADAAANCGACTSAAGRSADAGTEQAAE